METRYQKGTVIKKADSPESACLAELPPETDEYVFAIGTVAPGGTEPAPNRLLR